MAAFVRCEGLAVQNLCTVNSTKHNVGKTNVLILHTDFIEDLGVFTYFKPNVSQLVDYVFCYATELFVLSRTVSSPLL
jgi:hypothetical protein